MRSLFGCVLALLALTSLGCGGTESQQPIEESFEAVLIDTTAEFSPLRYADGTVTSNDRCPVRRKPLNPKVRPIFVNGQPIGFC